MRGAALVLVAAAAAGLGAWAATRPGGPGSHLRRPPAAARVTHVMAGSVAAALSLAARLPARVLTLPILMYHRIDLLKPSLPAITRRLTVDPRDFAAQMGWLVRHGYHAVTELQAFNALEHGARLPAKPIMITFDDGYRDVFGKAAPILARLHLPATAFIITDRISGPDPSFLTWGDLRALERRGIAIGSHTVTHRELPLLPHAEALAELRDSRAVLERHLGHAVQWFAYPSGAFDARVVQLVREAGYLLAVTTRPGALQHADEPLELYRLRVLDSTGVSGLASLLGS